MSETRAYDFSDRNKDYAKITKNRKQDIEVIILKEFPEVPYTDKLNGYVLSEEIKMIAEYHDRGEALCSHQDVRGENNPMYNRHHSEESKLKNKMSNLNFNNTNKTWYNNLNEDEIIAHKRISSKAARGKIWVYKDSVRKYIKPLELEDYLKSGWIKGRPSEIISKGNRKRDCNKFIKRTKCLLTHNNVEKIFESVADLYEFCKEEYDLSSGTVKHLLSTEEIFIPHFTKHSKAKGLSLKRI